MAISDPLSDKLVTLLGGSGFLGNYVTQSLLSRGARLRIVSRNPVRCHKLQPLSNLGQLQIGRCDIQNEQQLFAAISGADAVVNLVGAFGGDLNALMGRAAGKAASIAAECGVSRFVQVSAIGADAEGVSRYGQAKARGETLVREAFPAATIIRPSVIFASDDTFLNLFAELIKLFPAVPVFGPNAAMQPVFADDVANAITTALADPKAHGGKLYELGGPEVMTMMEINQRIADAQHRSTALLPVPDFASAIFASLPLTPMSRDQWAMLQSGNVVSSGSAGFKQLGIDPKPLGLFLDKWMVHHRKHGRFAPA